MSDISLEGAIRTWSESRRLPSSHLERWLSWAEQDRAMLIAIAKQLRLRTGQCVAAIDLLEEISVREACSIKAILEHGDIKRVLAGPGSTPAKARAFLDDLRALRFPRLSSTIRAIRQRIAEIGLPAAVKVSSAPNLSSDELRIEVIAHGGAELSNLLEKLETKRAQLCAIADMLGNADEV